METIESLRGAFDADAVEKILTNLLSNAIKFTPSGGSVHVALSSDGASARLVVRDSGPGIPPDQIAHVFERFYQVDESTTRTQPGTGIGLSLVKELVELHGGRVAVESGSDGTTFTATIPIGDVQAGVAIPDATDVPGAMAVGTIVTTEHDASAADSLGDDRGEDVPTLLVVDDSADLRSYIRDHFAARFHVLEAADGAEGIALARRHLPDVVLSDVMMPGTDGHELVRVLRASAETDFLAIVLLTAQAEDEQRLEGLERGADEYMVKPFEMRELDVRVRNLIASRRRLRERFSKGFVAAVRLRSGQARRRRRAPSRLVSRPPTRRTSRACEARSNRASLIPSSAWASWRTRCRRTGRICSGASSCSSGNRRPTSSGECGWRKASGSSPPDRER